MNNTLCVVSDTVLNPWVLYLILEFILAVACVFLVIHSLLPIKKTKNIWIVCMLECVAYFFAFVFLSFFLLRAFFSAFFRDDLPPSTQFHNLNAAIKNTCFLDPEKKHCPYTVEEIIQIEPQTFIKQTKDVRLTYQYYPETNDYTLIIRNVDPAVNNDRVAIFDSRFPKIKNTYGSRSYGANIDFVEERIIKCNGKYQLLDQPPFDGPWDRIN